jgi:hypothetical protein
MAAMAAIAGRRSPLHTRDGKEEGDTEPEEDRTGSTAPGILSQKLQITTTTFLLIPGSY